MKKLLAFATILLLAQSSQAAVTATISGTTLVVTGTAAADVAVLTSSSLNGQPLPEGEFTSVSVNLQQGNDYLAMTDFTVSGSITIATNIGDDEIAVGMIECGNLKITTGLVTSTAEADKVSLDHVKAADISVVLTNRPSKAVQEVSYNHVEASNFLQTVIGQGTFEAVDVKAKSASVYVMTGIGYGYGPGNVEVATDEFEMNEFGALQIINFNGNDVASVKNITISDLFLIWGGSGKDSLHLENVVGVDGAPIPRKSVREFETVD